MTALAQGGFGAIDWGVVALYIAFVFLVGLWWARKERSATDFFLAGRSMSMWMAAISVLVTSLSAVTFIGAPQDAFDGNLTYLVLNIGGLLAVVIVAVWFIPAYYRLGVTTVYELPGMRYGAGARLATSGMFMVGRVFASGARLYVAAIPLSLIAFGDLAPSHLVLSICIVAGVAMVYTLLGGIGAVMWTDAAQFLVLLIALGVSMAVLLGKIPLGAGEIVSTLREAQTPDGAGKLAVVDTRLDITLPYTLWTAIFGFTLFNLAAYATDQDLVQRMLTCRTALKGSWSVVVSNIMGIGVVALFLTLGLLLYLYYQRPDVMGGAAPGEPITDSRQVFLRFILEEIPPGLRGLMIAGLFAAAMSSLDSALNAMSSTLVCDFVRRLRPGMSAKQELRASRLGVAFWAVVLTGFAVACVWMQEESREGLLPFALGVMMYAYAGTLAVFLSALFTKRGSAWSVAAALVTGFVCVGALHLGPEWWEKRGVDFRPSMGWRMLIATAIAFAVCQLGRRAAPENSGG